MPNDKLLYLTEGQRGNCSHCHDGLCRGYSKISYNLTIWQMFVHYVWRPGREILVSYHTCPQGFFLRAWCCQHFMLHLYTHSKLSWIYTTVSFIKQLFHSLFHLFVFRMWYRRMHNLSNRIEGYVSRYGTVANIVQHSLAIPAPYTDGCSL